MSATSRIAKPSRPGPYTRFVQRIGHSRAAAALIRAVGARLDGALYRLSGGRIKATGGGSPVLLLTTTGRRSGRPRTTPVIYVRDGQRFVVSSESFGQQRRAAWPFNLDANPRASVQLGRRHLDVTARRATDAELTAYWPRLVEVWPAHETYFERSGQRHTFVLEPNAGAGAAP